LGSPAAAQEPAGFQFGSYGRIRAASDLRGEGPKWGNIVAHGSRLDLPPYLELEFRYATYPEKDLRVRVISTVAYAGDPFHYTGDWEANTAVRNMFVDVQGVGLKNLTLWAGARMYRGDDIYLLDFWPLDNLNTVGGGAALDVDRTRIALHVGQNRLLSGAFQYQERQVPSRAQFGAETVATLDRPRTIGSAKITQFFQPITSPKGYKASLYAEGHYLPEGTFAPETGQVVEPRELPSDTGFVVGAQGTAYGFGARQGHVHLFARYARGLAAYGDLAVPFGLDQERRSTKASEFLVAVGSNYEIDRFALLTGAYARRFRDGSTADYSRDHFWEGIVAARPQVFTTAHTALAAEVSYQFKNRNILDDDGKHEVPQAWRLSFIPTVTPLGWGSYTRPIIQAVYTATIRNQAAQDLYPLEDPRSDRRVEHYLGVQAEWWFNSSSYP